LLKGELGHCVFTGEFAQQALLDTIDEFVTAASAAAGHRQVDSV
jgi:hypothetical protein